MKKLFILISFCSLLISCRKNDDTQSSYSGAWSGTYIGSADNGSFIMNVDAAGKITGSASSLVFPEHMLLQVR